MIGGAPINFRLKATSLEPVEKGQDSGHLGL